MLSDVNGKLINLGPGNTGEVLTSQGAGVSPIWTAPGAITPAADKIHFNTLTNVPSILSTTVTNSSAPTLTLLTHNFTPTNDTVLFNFSSEGRLTSTVSLAAQPHTFVFRVIVNGTTYKQSYHHVVHNRAGATTSGFLPASFTIPVVVNPNVNNIIQVQVITIFTASGSITLTYDTSAFSQFAYSIVHDFKTN